MNKLNDFLSPLKTYGLIITPYDYNGRKYYANKPTKKYLKFLYPMEFKLSSGPVPTWEKEEEEKE